MTPRKIIVIGASAGGVEAIMQILRRLPAYLDASIFIVVHIPSHEPSLLPQIFNRVSALPVAHPQNMEIIQSGRIYVAPPDRHLIVSREHLKLSKSAKLNNSRPSIDKLFISAALSHKQDTIGLVLTGMLDDGSLGLVKIKRYGGIAIVQDPNEATYPQMPLNAIKQSNCDYVLPLAEIAELLMQLVSESTEQRGAEMSEENFDEANNLQNPLDSEHDIRGEKVYQRGKPSVYSCPDCGGVLAEIEEDGVLHFECRVGHSYSLKWAMAMQAENVEKALWTALRALDESISLARKTAEYQSDEAIQQEYLEKANDYERQSAILRTLLLK